MREVVVGYAGGEAPSPTYRNIQDHTETVRVLFDPSVVAYEELLLVAVEEMGGPPTRSRSSRRQYRSAILYHSETQREIAQRFLEGQRRLLGVPHIHIDVEPGTDFYRAEEYHQKYYEKSGMH